MLRASSQQEGFEANLTAVTSSDADAGVKHSDLLRLLTEATIQHQWNDLAEYRAEAISVMGPEATVDALAVASGFNGITRVADATGIPIDHYEDEVGKEIRSKLGIDQFEYDVKSVLYG